MRGQQIVDAYEYGRGVGMVHSEAFELAKLFAKVGIEHVDVFYTAAYISLRGEGYNTEAADKQANIYVGKLKSLASRG